MLRPDQHNCLVPVPHGPESWVGQSEIYFYFKTIYRFPLESSCKIWKLDLPNKQSNGISYWLQYQGPIKAVKFAINVLARGTTADWLHFLASEFSNRLLKQIFLSNLKAVCILVIDMLWQRNACTLHKHLHTIGNTELRYGLDIPSIQVVQWSKAVHTLLNVAIQVNSQGGVSLGSQIFKTRPLLATKWFKLHFC